MLCAECRADELLCADRPGASKINLHHTGESYVIRRSKSYVVRRSNRDA